jgi:NAD(P)-dependent dehydrogenase (short-subunit alcohol dehydrogenase family)
MAETILITGCSSGIGAEAARTMASRGWRVFATARKPDDLERLGQIERVTPVELNLDDPASVEACAARVIEETGGQVDALFNNAAFGQPGAVEDLSRDVLRAQLETNVLGTHHLTTCIIPAMRARGRGRIVQCSSVLGFVTGPYRGAYSSSKYALEALSDAMRLELRGTGIHVSIIEPGPIKSRFVDRALSQARANIDIDGSVHSAVYKRLLGALESGGKQRFKLQPEDVVKKLIHATESSRPKIRYFVTVPTYAAAVVKRMMPDRVADWFAAKS